jgi:hypothetical protein
MTRGSASAAPCGNAVGGRRRRACAFWEQGLSGDDRDVDRRPAARVTAARLRRLSGEAGHRPSNRGALAGLVGVEVHRYLLLADDNARLDAASGSITPSGVSPRVVYRRFRTTPARLAPLSGADHLGVYAAGERWAAVSDGGSRSAEDARRRSPAGLLTVRRLPSCRSRDHDCA